MLLFLQASVLFNIFLICSGEQCEFDYCDLNPHETFQNESQIKLSNLEYNCNCKNDCNEFDDCCENMKMELKNKNKMYKCNLIIDSVYFYSISDCNENWPNDGIRKKCQLDQDFLELKPDLQIPIYSYKRNFTYKNIFCAKCNYESVEHLKVLKMKATFEDGELHNLTYCFEGNKTRCKFSNVAESDFTMRKCNKSIDSCPTNFKNSEIVSKCLNQIAYRHYKIDSGDRIVYKNKYCGICNGVNESLLSCYPTLGSPPYRGLFFLQSIQVLFDLSDFKGNIHVGYKNDKTDKIIACQSEDDDDSTSSLMCSETKNNSAKPLKTAKNDTKIKTPVADVIKSYITFIGNLVSIISLILLLLVYSILKNLRNLAGKILMSLSVSLLFAQLFFLLSNYVPKDELDSFQLFGKITLCYTFALLTHYFYLTYFAWSNIMSFDLFVAFYSIQKKSHSTSTFIKYSLYAWMTPLIIILIMFTVRLTINKNYEIYAKNFCLLSYKEDLLIFFVIPIFLFLFFNLIFFIMSVITIRKIDKNSNLYLKKANVSTTNATTSETNTSVHAASTTESEYFFKQNNNKLKSNLKKAASVNEKSAENKDIQKQRLVLFLKLFVLMGCCWCTTVVHSFIKESFIWYIYIIINSLQGFLMFITVIFNRQTIKEIKKNKYFMYLK